MKLLSQFLFLIFLIFSFEGGLIHIVNAQDESTLYKIKDAYKNIDDAMGSFIQTSYIKDVEKTQSFKGKFFIKADKIRWQYLGEFPQIIYLNKDTLTVYDKSKKQAIQSKFSVDTYGQLPLTLLSRMADLAIDFKVKEKSSDTLVLIPKSKMGNIQQIELIVQGGDFPVKSLKVIDTMGNRIKIDFYNVKVNSGLKDSIFKFVPKKDDTVLRY